MLLVKTKVGPSPIHGIGLFADEFIPKGTVVWEFRKGFELELTRADIDALSPSVREQVEEYAYLDTSTGKYVLCSDDARFFNHSEKPNVASLIDDAGHDYKDVANRDIEKGDELTTDYSAFDANSSRDMYQE